jgi:hypothetical protein
MDQKTKLPGLPFYELPVVAVVSTFSFPVPSLLLQILMID